MTGFHELTWVASVSACTFGMLLALAGCLKAPLARHLNIADDQAGALLATIHLTLLPTMPLAGLLVDSWGAREVLVLGALLSSVALFTLSQGQTYRASLYAVLLTGSGAACIGNGATVIMPRAFFENSPAASLNLGYIFFGLGALLAPVAFSGLIHVAGLRGALGLLALFCLLAALLAVLCPAAAFALPASAKRDVFSKPLLWLAGLMLMLYGPLESWLGAPSRRHLEEIRFAPRGAALLLATVWLAFLTARLLAALLQQQEAFLPAGDIWLVLLLVLLAAAALGNVAGTLQRDRAAVCLVLLGFFLGPIFPTLAGFVLSHFDPTDHGTAFGLLFALGTAGTLALAPLHLARPAATRPTFHIGAAIVLIVAGLALALTQ